MDQLCRSILTAPTPAGFYYQAGVTAYLIDPAGTFSQAGASVPTPAAAGTYIPGTGATSSAAEIVDPAGTFSPASASAPILAAAGTYVPGAGATFYAAERVDLAATYSGSGASALTLAPAGAYIPIGASSAAAEIVDPAEPYSGAGPSAPTTDPAGWYSAAGAGAPTLAAPDAYIPVIEATSAARKIVSPPGTYLPPGATAPVADRGGTYSGYDASAPTTDQAGTYSSPSALNCLFLVWKNTTPANVVLPFNSVTAVENYYGATSSEATLATDFFAKYYGDTSATMLFTRTNTQRRPHLLGANISNLLTPNQNQLENISGSLALTFDGYTYSGHVNLSGVTSFLDAAGKIRAALDRNLQVAAVTTESSIVSKRVSFSGYTDRSHLFVTSGHVRQH